MIGTLFMALISAVAGFALLPPEYRANHFAYLGPTAAIDFPPLRSLRKSLSEGLRARRTPEVTIPLDLSTLTRPEMDTSEETVAAFHPPAAPPLEPTHGNVPPPASQAHPDPMHVPPAAQDKADHAKGMATHSPEAAVLKTAPVQASVLPAAPPRPVKESLLEVAAEAGDVEAQHRLAMALFNGDDMPQDRVAAAHWSERAARSGSSAAMVQLGGILLQGIGIAADLEQARTWFRKAADLNNRVAQFNLGQIYRRGAGVVADASAAVFWYRKAADQNFAPAQFNLGLMYYEGDGVPRDLLESYLWIDRAALQGDPQAVKLRTLLAQNLPDNLFQGPETENGDTGKSVSGK